MNIYATVRQCFKGDYDIIAITMATVELCEVSSKTHMHVLQIIVKTNLLTLFFSHFQSTTNYVFFLAIHV